MKHVVEWDVHIVFEYFKSERFHDWKQLLDKDITIKTVFVLALATGKRRSKIHALSRDVRVKNVRMVEIFSIPCFMSKTHVSTNRLGALRPIMLSALP